MQPLASGQFPFCTCSFTTSRRVKKLCTATHAHNVRSGSVIPAADGCFSSFSAGTAASGNKSRTSKRSPPPRFSQAALQSLPNAKNLLWFHRNSSKVNVMPHTLRKVPLRNLYKLLRLQQQRNHDGSLRNSFHEFMKPEGAALLRICWQQNSFL